MDSGIMQAFWWRCILFFGSCRMSRSAVRQPSDFSQAMDGQKTILWNRALFSTHPSPAKNYKTTIIPLEGSEDFFGGRCGKSNALSEAAFPTSTPLKNRWNRGGDDRQVSQNGMPFCTGCTLYGHILNLQGSSTPFEPLVSFPKIETAKHPLEVSSFYFRIRWGIYPPHYILHRQKFCGCFSVNDAICINGKPILEMCGQLFCELFY